MPQGKRSRSGDGKVSNFADFCTGIFRTTCDFCLDFVMGRC